MRHWIVTVVLGFSTLAGPAGAFDNDYHLVLNGFSQEVHASDGYFGVLGTSARTISWWYRSHDQSFPTTWGIVHWGQSWTVQLQNVEDGILYVEASGNAGGTKFGWSILRNPAIPSLQDGQWHHLVVTAPDSGTMEDVRFYLNGSEVPVVSVAGGTLTNAYDTPSDNPVVSVFRVGTRALGNHADADMDEIALWDAELDAAAVAEIFNGGVPTDLEVNGASYANAGDLQLYWRFEEGSGLETADTAGNGHDGDLIGGDTVASWGTNPPGSGADSDGDGILDGFDNCVDDANPGQEDADSDQVGDACDEYPDDPDNEQAQCEVDLDQCLLIPPFVDSDQDGEDDSTDSCLDTPEAETVDGNGCSIDQFCSVISAADRTGSRTCKKADWHNDEPLMRGRERDCTINKQGRGRDDDLCVPNPES